MPHNAPHNEADMNRRVETHYLFAANLDVEYKLSIYQNNAMPKFTPNTVDQKSVFRPIRFLEEADVEVAQR